MPEDKNDMLPDAEDLNHSEFTAQNFSQVAREVLRDPASNRGTTKVSFTDLTKDSILGYLKSPESNVKSLRNASIAMYNNSPQYRRLAQYYAYMPVWAYTVSPMGFDPSKKDVDACLKSYTKAINTIDTMNIRHEMSKALLISIVEGIFCGAIWSTNSSFFIQRINPDYCTLTSIEDGTWMYSVDMSKIKEEDLEKYPPEFTTMWNTYKSTGQVLQEVPSKISFCLKGDEATTYPNPPLSGILPEIYDLYTYKGLAEVAKDIENYKLINMQTPVDSQGKPTITLPLMKEYYNHIAQNLPSYVGLAMSPTKLESITFDKSKAASSTDEIASATQRFWYASGVSPLLFGDAANNTANALSQSIKADEEFVFAMMYQCERLINRRLKSLPGSQKWKIQFIPVTWFSLDKYLERVKEGATLGLPVKSAYASLVNIQQTDISSMAFLENDVLDLPNILVPLKTSYTQTTADNGGRTPSSEEDLTAEGEKTRNKQ